MGMYEPLDERRKRERYETLRAFTKALRVTIQAAKRANEILGDVEDVDGVTTIMTGYPPYMPSFDKFTRDMAKWEEAASKEAARAVYSYDRGVDTEGG